MRSIAWSTGVVSSSLASVLLLPLVAHANAVEPVFTFALPEPGGAAWMARGCAGVGWVTHRRTRRGPPRPERPVAEPTDAKKGDETAEGGPPKQPGS